MKFTFTKYIVLICLFIGISEAFSQGCIAVRSGAGVNVGGGAVLGKGQWNAATNFRYFHSYKHFRGKHEETERVENGTEVINDSYFLDFLVAYGISDRLSVNFVLPFVNHARSSMYEHGGNPPNGLGDRHFTYSSGLADIRFGASYWLLDPATHAGSNISLGLGMKLPSGNYRAKGKFYNQGPNRDQVITSGLDQSIQPGDGGVGITFESQAYHNISEKLVVSALLYYMVNPREKYSTTNFRGSASELSVSDQYAARLGALYVTPVQGLGLYGGARLEGVPASDLIGGDEGFRRPGYIVSLEPGVNYGVGNMAFSLTVPIAVDRARVQNFSDKQRTKETGELVNGDAAFADYLINFGFTYRFGMARHTVDVNDFTGSQN
ncbi:MAG: transporter [Imperialibacter sp.]|uniref:transporter n=1 Tax=Imperialibacter sp. TaxID=2038411 RepID=UPI0032EBDA17